MKGLYAIYRANKTERQYRFAPTKSLYFNALCLFGVVAALSNKDSFLLERFAHGADERRQFRLAMIGPMEVSFDDIHHR